MSETAQKIKVLAAALYRLEWDADLYATPRGPATERYEKRAERLSAAGFGLVADALGGKP